MSTTLRILHSTIYRYSEPVRFGQHRLLIRPREGHDLRVEKLELRISPDHDITWTRDVFGNSVALVDFLEPADTLSIQSDVHLLRHERLPRKASPPPSSVPFPIVYDALESAVAAAYRATTYGDDANLVHDFLRNNNFLSPNFRDAELLLDALNQFLFQNIAYNRRPEKGTQSPAQTLDKKTGSCRDLATLMLESCRSLGIAARFASGYLDCPASAAGQASTHAWIEAYIPPLGWLPFDPTLGERCSHKHIPCALSNHPRAVMPISGAYSPTPTSTYLGMEVAVQIQK